MSDHDTDGDDDQQLEKKHNWITLFGEREAVEVVGGPFDGQQGYIVEGWIDARKDATQPISYIVHLLTNGVNERIRHDHLKSLGYKYVSLFERGES